MMILNPYRFAASSGPSAWETAVAALSPDVWLKCNEATEAAFEAHGNYGAGGGTCIADSLTFGSTPVMPSEPARTTVLSDASGGQQMRCFGTTTPALNSTAAIYCIFKGTTFGPSAIMWRDATDGTGGGWFLQVSGTNVNMRIRGANKTTTYPSANLFDGNPHLIGVAVSATDVSLWVDGVEVWADTIGGSTATRPDWYYTSNTLTGQRPYGNFGDFIVFPATLTDAEHEALYDAFAGP